MQTIIIAGGIASRLKPISDKTPKSLIKIQKKPFIEYQLKLLKKNGITDVVLCLGHFANKIKNFIGDGKKFDLKIKYSYDGNEQLGTGGAIKKAFNLLDEEFFIIYGDSFLPINFKPILKKFKKNNSDALMTIFKNENLLDKNNVLFEKKKIALYSKNKKYFNMNYIDYGLSIVKKKVFYNSKKKFGLDSLFYKLSKEKKLDHFVVSKRFYEIGSFDGIKDFKLYVKKNNII